MVCILSSYLSKKHIVLYMPIFMSRVPKDYQWLLSMEIVIIFESNVLCYNYDH